MPPVPSRLESPSASILATFNTTASRGIGAFIPSASNPGSRPAQNSVERSEGQQDEGGQEAKSSEPPHFAPVWSRWYAPGNPVLLGDGTALEPPAYEINERGAWWNSYRQNKLKGDFPIWGTEDIFFSLTVTQRTFAEARDVPTRTGITGPGPSDPDFFGDGDQFALSNDLAVSFDLFKGQQGFKPVDWRFKATPVLNYNYLSVNEVGVVNVDVSEGETREHTDFGLQEALVEYHLVDWNDRYDFLSLEVGILPFRSDFRGFIFDDSNLGVRLFGNAVNNKWQYNLALFDLLDKNSNSLLNTSDSRDQQVAIANLYRQDWPFLGYTTSFSAHYNRDHRGFHFNDNGFLINPAPVGLAQEHEIDAVYLGWAGEGHIERINVTHALYQVYGEDSRNPFAGREVDINAQFAALELSYDIDWWRVRGYGMYASGDSDTRDGDAEGFDAILDAANFAGGPLSYFNGQVLNLTGTQLTNFQSFLPDLQTSKFEGQSNFVNPGVLLFGSAVDLEITPTLRSQLGLNYLRFVETDSLEVFLELPEVEREIGLEAFLGFLWRPWLTNNVLVNYGISALDPGDGFARIYQSDDLLYSTFLNLTLTF